ncbi:hypothetical protein XENTR_v10021454 [Xenopus tropicalis]|nr:hypothetical protein XENTR_v10021454 [Xenopus tropicalis]
MENGAQVGVLLVAPETLHEANEERPNNGGIELAAESGIIIPQGSTWAEGARMAEVAQMLRELGYKGPLCCEKELERSAKLGAASQHFTALCAWLVSELKVVSSMVENISPTEGPEDAETFQLEMSGVVNELHCPYTALTTGDVTCRLTNLDNCLQLLVFLSTELQAARIISNRKVPVIGSEKGNTEAIQELKWVGATLGIQEYLLGVPVAEYMRILQNKIAEITAALPDSSWSSPLLKTELQPSQWEKLADLHCQLLGEYECRMRMLVTRFDVTVQSFYWSERAKVRENLFLTSILFDYSPAFILIFFIRAQRKITFQIVYYYPVQWPQPIFTKPSSCPSPCSVSNTSVFLLVCHFAVNGSLQWSRLAMFS